MVNPNPNPLTYVYRTVINNIIQLYTAHIQIFYPWAMKVIQVSLTFIYLCIIINQAQKQKFYCCGSHT